MKISIIVAIYNAESTIRRCLDSLKGQTYKDIEVLMVDDCSEDNCPSILEEYASNDNRFFFFQTLSNGGPAKARNLALKHFTGDVVMFVDSDDWISRDAVELMTTEFQHDSETGCVLFDVVECYNDGRKQHYPMADFRETSGFNAFKESLTWKIHGVYAARSALSRRFPYDETSKWYSDDNTTRLHYLLSPTVRTCRGIYYYWQNENSISHAVNIQRMDYMRANESMKATLLSLDIPRKEHILNIYERVRWLVLVDCYYFYYNNRSLFSAQERDYCVTEIQRVWKGIELKRIPLKLRYKFGYCPFKSCWGLFRLQEELYFTLKKLWHKFGHCRKNM